MTFRPGESGNPGGRPRAVVAIRELVQAKGPDLVERLMTMALADNTEDRVRIECIKVLLDRGYGRPPQPITGEDGASGPQRIVVGWLPTEDKEG